MSKRVFELAKELNTTSKRLMEKLEEINITVKSHMSLLEEDELNRLYKHIGVVNRSRVNGSDDGNNTDQQEQADSLVRKTIPRIIRKTEIIIHDDDYEHDNQKDRKKNKRGFVRTSSSTDGLMAGLQRGSDNRIPSIRKHKPEADRQIEAEKPALKKKTEETKVSPVVSDNEIIGITQRGDRIRRPVDSILGIKKVSSREDREKQTGDEQAMRDDVPRAELQEEVQEIKDTTQTAQAPKQDAQESKQKLQVKTEQGVQESNAVKQDINVPTREEKTKVDIDNIEEKTTFVNQKETVSAKAENSKAHMVMDTQKAQEAGEGNKIQQNPEEVRQQNKPAPQPQPEETPAETEASDDRRETQSRPLTADSKTEAVKDNKREQSQEKKESPRVQEADRSREHAIAQEQRQFRDKTSKPAGFRDIQQSGVQQSDRQGKGPRGEERVNKNEAGNRGANRDDQNRSFNRDDQNRSYNRDDQNRGYNRDDQNRSFNRDDQNRGFNRDQNRGFNRDGERSTGGGRDGQGMNFNRDGGQNRGPGRDGGSREFNRDTGGNRGPRSGGDTRDFRRDGDSRPFNRDGGDRGPIRGKDDRGFVRNRDQSPKGRNDDRNRGVSKPLVIPKANLAPGQVEEKNNLRGERRSAITRDLEKGFKREAKKEQPKKDLIKAPVVTGLDKSKEKYKKSLVVGHKASVSDMYSDDYVLNEFYEEKEKLKKDRKRREEKHIPPKAVLHEITIPETISVKNLSEALKKTSAEVIKKLMGLGIMANLNQELDFDTAAIIGDEFRVKVNKEVVVSDEDILFDDMQDKEEDLVERAPVVVVMGHVDHGKTSLLDAIRKTNVVDTEAGGITQHIGAYKVNIHGRDIAFLDTPGHEAFTAMRARGAQATDIAILVVAADDGVMPQTIEAINHAKAANVSLIVAINKIDKPGANPDRVKQELADRGVLIEEWGGDVIAVPVSAKLGTNIEQLLEMVLLTADILELKANPNRQAKGIIIEAKLDKGRGPVATVLVQRGTLHSGDSIISGTTFGRIRAMTDENGRKIDIAGPSTPAEIIGLDDVPEAGDVFYAVSEDRVAKHLVDKRKAEQREQAIGGIRRVSLDDLFSQIQQGNVKELNIIVKADVQGSVEALRQSVEKLSNEEVKVQIIHGGVGAVNEADVTLASVSNAIIIGFNVRPPANVMEAAEAAGVDIRLYRIIYDAIGDIEKAMKGMLEPTYKEVIDGHVELRQIFKASNVGTIGGGYVTDGKISRNSDVRVVRNGIVVYEGKLGSLKRFKDDVREVAQGYECGILIDRFNDIKEGDVIEAFRMEEVERT